MRLFTAFALAIPLLALPARAETPPGVIRFAEVGGGTARPAGSGLAPLAQKLGLFQKEFGGKGPKIQINYFLGTGPAINEALAQGQSDFGSYGGLPNVIGLAGGIPAKAVLIRRSTGLTGLVAVQPNLPLKSFADLRGKRIAVQKGTNPYMTLVLSLEDAGVRESAVRIVNLQRPEAQAAFISGHVDAVYGQSQLFALRDQGKARVLASPDIPGVIAVNHSATLVNNGFAQRHPQTTRRVVKVLVQAAHWASQPQNRAAYLQFVSESGIPLKYVEESYGQNLKPRFDPRITPEAISGFGHIAAFAHGHRLIRSPRVSNDWFEPKFLQAALKELKLETYWDSQAVSAR